MRYRRVLVKLSGELFSSEAKEVDIVWLNRIADEICEAMHKGVQVAVVVGGGNIFRGASLAEQGIDRICADSVGMLSTIINAMILSDIFEQRGVETHILSAISVSGMAQPFSVKQSKQVLRKGALLILAGGTGNPLVTTDSAASLRAVEIGADVLLKATRVDGVYSSDPLRSEAEKYQKISFEEVIAKDLKVMDKGAFVQCHQFSLPICVFDVNRPKALLRALGGESEGTLISGD